MNKWDTYISLFVLVFVCLIVWGCGRQTAHYRSFKYHDPVVITNGFYKGEEGVVVGQNDTFRLTVQLKNKTVYPLSWDLEKQK